jgi:hypothetical protein
MKELLTMALNAVVAESLNVDVDRDTATLFVLIAQIRVADRPGRAEPRAVKTQAQALSAPGQTSPESTDGDRKTRTR